METTTIANRTAVIKVVNLCKSFGDNVVLNNFSFCLYEGENLVVIGRSGAGKSVLIKCIVGLITPESGDIFLFGENIKGMEPKRLDEIRAKIGFLFQSGALYDSMTVRENLEFSLRRHLNIKDKRELSDRVAKALQDVGLPDTVDMMPSELSGGMRKRIGLARSLIMNPTIMLYDEPTAGLDPITGREISKLIMKVQEQYKTSSIIITHDLSCAAITANRVNILDNATVYMEGNYEEIRTSMDSNVRQFFNDISK